MAKWSAVVLILLLVFIETLHTHYHHMQHENCETIVK